MSVTQECPECHRQFTPYNHRKNVVFCSYECQLAYRVRKSRELRQSRLAAQDPQCPECHTAFTPTRASQAFCSAACLERYRVTRRSSKAHSERQPSKCSVCESEFLPPNGNARYCSIPCRHKARTQQVKAKRLTDPQKSRQYQSEYRKQNNKAVLKHRLKHWYGISLAEYDAIAASQTDANGVLRCAICGTDQAGGRYNRFHLDHSHSTQKARSLLCGACNQGLGAFRENIETMKAAVAYLERHGSAQADSDTT